MWDQDCHITCDERYSQYFFIALIVKLLYGEVGTAHILKLSVFYTVKRKEKKKKGADGPFKVFKV